MADDSHTLEVTETVDGEADTAGIDVLPEGSVVGRFQVGRVIGAGGMGVVYEALDPSLGRHVALKLVAVERGRRGPRTRVRDRMLREARALAQLSHPNVVTVHECGKVSDDIYIAMELVAGETMDIWLRKGRSRDEILRAFIDAGEGLAAAHDAGLVHRDFKPQNVIVGDDGRVRVIDFGLARVLGRGDGTSSAGESLDEVSASDADERASLPPPTTPTSPGISAAPRGALTEAGAVMGTPRFMSPEQHAGEDADARSDQYSYCVALYEALTDIPPFVGKSREALRTAIERQEIQAPPKGKTLPRWLSRAVTRGLAAEPGHRHPSMRGLLSELKRERFAPARVLGLSALLVAVAAGVLLAATRQTPLDECNRGSVQADSLLPAEQFTRMEASFAGTGFKAASTAAQDVRRLVSRFKSGFQESYTRACQATFGDLEQSTYLLDLKTSCLKRKKNQLSALLETFEHTENKKTVQVATEATVRVSSLVHCEDSQALTSAVPPPEDIRVRGRVDDAWRTLDRAESLQLAAHFEQALTLTTELRQGIEDLDYPPIHAAVKRRMGDILQEEGKYEDALTLFRESAHDAASARDYQQLALAWGAELWMVGDKLTRFDEAEAFLRSVDAVRQMLRDDPRTQARLDLYAVNFLNRKGDFRRARALLERSTRLLEPLPARDELWFVLKNNLGIVSLRQGEYAQAREAFEEAERGYAELYGPLHPKTITPTSNLGRVHAELRDFPEAIRLFRLVRESDEHYLGTDHPIYAASSSNLALALMDIGEVAEANDLLTDALEVFRVALGNDHAHIPKAIHNLARARNEMGRKDEAAQLYADALAMFERLGKLDTEDAALTQSSYAGHLCRTGHPSECLQHATRAAAFYREHVGAKHREYGSAHLTRAEALYLLQREDEALAAERVASEILGSLPNLAPEKRAALLYLRARLIRNDPSQAVPLAQRALALARTANMKATGELRAGLQAFIDEASR